MSKEITIEVPDIGDFSAVDVVEVLVSVGDFVEKETPLITLETDKASMDIPATHAGIIKKLLIAKGNTVSKGTPIAIIETQKVEQKSQDKKTIPAEKTASPVPGISTKTYSNIKVDIETEVAVLGSGPGGYTAAFRAADLGKRVVLIERYPTLGGVCLNVGCIPSKALLHTAMIINEAATMAEHGIDFGKPQINLQKLATYKESVIKKLTGGLASMAKQRNIHRVQGNGRFITPHHIEVETPDGAHVIAFEHAIIAAGSQAVKIPGFPYHDPRLMDSTDALLLEETPKRLLVIGGGIIGLEMAMVYDSLGSQVTVVELMEGLMPGADRDLIKPLEKIIRSRYENIFTGTRVTKIAAEKQGLKVYFEGSKAPASDVFNRVLVAVGRSPNGKKIDAENAGVYINERGFIPVDKQQRTNIEHIFAIGDIVGQPMLAHKATHEGKVAAEVIAGHKRYLDARTIPSVAYTDPEVAWMGLTETDAQLQGIEYDKASFPWAASGRSLSLGRSEGITKLIYDKQNRQILGAGIVGPNAGELIAETVLALEMGADIEDIGLTIHPHPTLSETINFAAEVAEGSITDLYIPQKKHK